MIVICTYCLDRCGASEIIDVVVNHQLALIRRQGTWERIEASEHKRAREELQESEAHYRSLVENAVDMIYCLDRQRKVTYASPQLLRALGYTRKELLGRPS